MPIPKDFDCVELKNSIQAKLLKEYQNMNAKEAEDHLRQKILSSKSPVIRVWQEIQAKQQFKKAG